MSISEVAGRLTLARLIVRDFTAAVSSQNPMTQHELLEWAHRVNTALAKLVTSLDTALQNQTVKISAGGAIISANDLKDILTALDDAIIYKMLTDPNAARRYRTLYANLDSE